MTKAAFIFPGQGSQYVSMGKDLYDKYTFIKELFAEADEALGYSLSQICFEGPEDVLKQTSNTQPAVLTASVGCWLLLKESGIYPDFVGGHSLGEYSALVASGVLDFRDAVMLVHKRGQFMEEAVSQGKGIMAAVLGMERDILEQICHEVNGIVETVNYNCPGQIVIAGETTAVEQAGILAKQRGAKRFLPLQVSGPFHSSLMYPAAQKLVPLLEDTVMKSPKIPVVANVTADYITEANLVRQALISQVDHPVRWQESMERLNGDGVSTFVEVGPGKVLSGLIKKIHRSSTILNVEDQDSLEKTLVTLKGGD